jgi:hypothetical protein
VPALDIGMSMSYMLSDYFHDPNGSDLSYTASSSDPAVATASAANGTLTVTAVSAGMATITVTAMDAEGLTAPLMFMVAVPEPAPEPMGPQAMDMSYDIMLDEDLEIDMDTLFTMAGTSYSVKVSDTTIVRSRTQHGSSMMLLTALKEGAAEVMVTASYDDYDDVTASVMVNVPNSGPMRVGNLDSQVDDYVLGDDGNVGVVWYPVVAAVVDGDQSGQEDTDIPDLSALFTDADEEMLTYMARSTDNQDVRVLVGCGTGATGGCAYGTPPTTLIDVVHYIPIDPDRRIEIEVRASDGDADTDALTFTVDVDDTATARSYVVAQNDYGFGPAGTRIQDYVRNVDFRRLAPDISHRLIFEGGLTFVNEAITETVVAVGADNVNPDDAPAGGYYVVSTDGDTVSGVSLREGAGNEEDEEGTALGSEDVVIAFMTEGAGESTITITYYTAEVDHDEDEDTPMKRLSASASLRVMVEAVD